MSDFLPLAERIDLTEKRIAALARVRRGVGRSQIRSLRRSLAELYEQDGNPERARTSEYMGNSDRKERFA